MHFLAIELLPLLKLFVNSVSATEFSRDSNQHGKALVLEIGLVPKASCERRGLIGKRKTTFVIRFSDATELPPPLTKESRRFREKAIQKCRCSLSISHLSPSCCSGPRVWEGDGPTIDPGRS